MWGDSGWGWGMGFGMISVVLFWILVVLTAAFAALHAFLHYGMKNLAADKSDIMHSFSIIVAARNEETNIARLVESLGRVEYPQDKY